ncbi:MAG: SCO1664 family protein [Candidatus Rokubacteria bacterium]|nr:SCO1664 family protein [Candidatus Rokubacteria bacterium]
MDTPLHTLSRGDITVKGRIRWSSNATFVVDVTLDGHTVQAVYKPERGERPLWDFPPALYKRELAAYELSEALGWGLVPPTVVRDGPLGDGSLQLFVPADFERHYFTFCDEPAHHDRLRAICVFDLVANNADRKAGHCLLGADGAVWAIDNALTFNVEPKLRTVIWQFAGEPIPDDLVRDLRRVVARGAPDPVAKLIDDDEAKALRARARRLIADGRYPHDPGGRSYPWPLV